MPLRTTEDLLLKACDYIDAGDDKAALPLLARIVAFEPENTTAYRLWVTCHVELDRYDRALQLIDEGLARGLMAAELYAQKAFVLQLQGKWDPSMAAAMRALEIDCESSEAVLALGAAHFGRGDFETALETYRVALGTTRDKEAVHWALLELADELGRHEEAIAAAREYMRQFGRNAAVLSILGHHYTDVGDFRRADRAFRDAAREEPGTIDHHVNVLLLAMMTNDDAAFDGYMARLATNDEEFAERVWSAIKAILNAPPEGDEGPESTR